MTSVHQVYFNLGQAYLQQNQLENAEQEFVHALEGRNSEIPRFTESAAQALAMIGQAHFDDQRPDQAERVLSLALQYLDDTSRLKRDILRKRGECHIKLKEWNLARDTFREAQLWTSGEEDLNLKTRKEDLKTTIQSKQNLGICYAKLGSLDEAKECLFSSFKECMEQYGPDDALTIGASKNLNNLLASGSRMEYVITIEIEIEIY
jgi:tetratricopeptide (TPR) repeat protein